MSKFWSIRKNRSDSRDKKTNEKRDHNHRYVEIINKMDRSDDLTEAAPSPPDTLTVSTESETFESWTLVTEGPKNKRSETILSHSENEDRGEEVGEKKGDVIKREIENVDDLSDGISIISDSESPGRISPHPYLTNFRPGTIPSPLVSDQIPKDFIEIIASRNYESLPPAGQTTREEAEPIIGRETEIGTRFTLDGNQRREEPLQRTSILGLGRRGVVLISMLVCIFALLGRIQQPAWEHASILSKITPLSQRVDDLEWQNSLLRAEIDILTKQVNYLQNTKENVMQMEKIKKQFDGKPKLERTQNVWSGDGDFYTPETVNPVPNYKRDAKTKNGDFKKNTKDDAIEKNEKDNHRKESHDDRQLKGEHKSDRGKQQQKEKHEPTKHMKHDNEHQHSHENYKKFKHDYNSKENFDKTRKPGSNRKGNQDHSGEDSRENFHEHNKRRRNSKDDVDWQENRMRHREDLRKKKNSENWYIERGSGREEARSKEKKRR